MKAVASGAEVVHSVWGEEVSEQGEAVSGQVNQGNRSQEESSSRKEEGGQGGRGREQEGQRAGDGKGAENVDAGGMWCCCAKAGFEQFEAVWAISGSAAVIAANEDVENSGQPEDGQRWRNGVAQEPPGNSRVIWQLEPFRDTLQACNFSRAEPSKMCAHCTEESVPWVREECVRLSIASKNSGSGLVGPWSAMVSKGRP